MVTSAVFTPLYAPGLRKIIFESYSYREEEYSKYLNVGSSSRQYEDDYMMAGFGGVPTKPEGTSIVYDDPVSVNTMRWVWQARGKGFRATHEAMADELYGKLRGMAKSLGKAFRNQTEIDAAAVLNSGFTYSGTTNNGYDGKALFATDHPITRGSSSTQRNKPSADVDLGVTSLQDALIDFENQVDESSVPINGIPRNLVVPTQLMHVGAELLGSTAKPYTADNEINVLNRAGLSLLVLHYLTDTNAWFLLSEKGEHDLWYVWREKFMTAASDDFDTGDGKMKGYLRGAAGYGDYRNTWGTSGS